MGNKIITEKDFWVCSGGTTPAQLQTTQLSTKKESQHKYITVADTATSSWIDFGCKKLMLIMAILAAVLVVVVVATGGAALGAIIAAGAIAGAAGAAYGAVLGALICGQKAAAARKWLASKPDMIIQGQRAITGDHQMTCLLFGETITFAPQIKNWWQAISLSAANYIGGIMEGMLAGAAIGMGGAMLSGGASALAAGGVRGLGQAGLQLLKSMPRKFLGNAIESVSKVGLALRSVMGAQNTLATYGNTGSAGVSDFAKGVVAMETGAYDSVRNIAAGNGTWQDFAGIALMFSPVGKGKREIEDGITNRDGEPTRDGEENTKADEEGTNRAINQEGNAPKQEGEFEAYEGDTGGKTKLNGVAEDGYRIEAEGIKANTRSIEEASFSSENIGKVKEHLSQEMFSEGGEMAANNKEMIRRLEAIRDGKMEATPTDKAFLTHEVRELELMKRGMSYPDAHAQTCKEYGINAEAEKKAHSTHKKQTTLIISK